MILTRLVTAVSPLSDPALQGLAGLGSFTFILAGQTVPLPQALPSRSKVV